MAILATPKKFSMQAVFELLLRKPVDGSIIGYLTDLKTSGIENTMEMVYPSGGRGNPYIGTGFAHSRHATMNITSATWNMDVLASQNGTEVVRGSTPQTKYDIISADGSGDFFTTFTAIGTVGSEIKFLYIVDPATGTYNKTYTQVNGATPAAGEFTYTSGTKALAFDGADAPLPTDLVACAYTYNTASNAQRIDINADGIPPVVIATAYGLAVDNCSGETFMATIEGQAQVDGNWSFDLSADGEPSVQTLNLEFVKGCLEKTLYKFIVYTDEEE